MRVSALVGHERSDSRTRAVAEEAAAQLEQRAVADGLETSSHTVDLSELGDELLGGEAVERARDEVVASDLVIVASPTYKATYTGVLKVFLDGYGGAALSGRVAVPLMLASAPQHGMAGDAYLRPLLVELGATCPTPALFLLESDVDDRRARIAAWVDGAWPTISALVRSG